MSKTYTQHKLTDAMLRKLSRLSKGPFDFHSGTGTALATRGLVTGGRFEVYCQDNFVERDEDSPRLSFYEYESVSGVARSQNWFLERYGYDPYTITEAGREALAQARAEGW